MAETVDFYRRAGGPQLALDFVADIEACTVRIGRNPAIGSLEFAHDTSISDLRATHLERFPFVIFYVDRGDRIEIWRVLHTRRNISGILTADDPES